MPTWNLKYFKPDSKTDNWGDPDEIDLGLLEKLDGLRELIKSPIIVTSGYRDGDGSSQHHFGLAVDVISPAFTKKSSLLDFYLAAERFNFSGIGVYPHWEYQGKFVGGLHLDARPGAAARWMGVLKNLAVPFGKEQKYLQLTRENLIKYKVY